MGLWWDNCVVKERQTILFFSQNVAHWLYVLQKYSSLNCQRGRWRWIAQNFPTNQTSNTSVKVSCQSVWSVLMCVIQARFFLHLPPSYNSRLSPSLIIRVIWRPSAWLIGTFPEFHLLFFPAIGMSVFILHAKMQTFSTKIHRGIFCILSYISSAYLVSIYYIKKMLICFVFHFLSLYINQKIFIFMIPFFCVYVIWVLDFFTRLPKLCSVTIFQLKLAVFNFQLPKAGILSRLESRSQQNLPACVLVVRQH